MNVQHQQLAAGKWQELSLIEQLANIGSEVERALNWQEKGDSDYSRQAFFRALELLDLSLNDPKNTTGLTELARLREVLADYFYFGNQYGSSKNQWRKYFYSFNYAASLARGR